LHFSDYSPERFKDKNNEAIRQQLEREKVSYLTCLQIGNVFRGSVSGVMELSKLAEEILKEFHNYRCVVSNEKLIRHYQYFGGEIINNIDNEDHLTIMTFDEKSFIKRH
jgi:hypothetical protein